MGQNAILIVDDDEGIQDILRLALQMHDYPVAVASNGKEALALLENMPAPCLIVTDLMMPTMNGREFIDELDRHPEWSQIPVAIVSAFADQARLVERPVSVIEKPIELTKLMNLVRQFCA
jgi:CheY-like chemotaxis protein